MKTPQTDIPNPGRIELQAGWYLIAEHSEPYQDDFGETVTDKYWNLKNLGFDENIPITLSDEMGRALAEDFARPAQSGGLRADEATVSAAFKSFRATVNYQAALQNAADAAQRPDALWSAFFNGYCAAIGQGAYAPFKCLSAPSVEATGEAGPSVPTITITGPVGCGKTVVAFAIQTMLRDRFKALSMIEGDMTGRTEDKPLDWEIEMVRAQGWKITEVAAPALPAPSGGKVEG